MNESRWIHKQIYWSEKSENLMIKGRFSFFLKTGKLFLSVTGEGKEKLETFPGKLNQQKFSFIKNYPKKEGEEKPQEVENSWKDVKKVFLMSRSTSFVRFQVYVFFFKGMHDIPSEEFFN